MQWVFPIIGLISSSLAFNKFFNRYNNYLNFYVRLNRDTKSIFLVNLTSLKNYLFINNINNKNIEQDIFKQKSQLTNLRRRFFIRCQNLNIINFLNDNFSKLICLTSSLRPRRYSFTNKLYLIINNRGKVEQEITLDLPLIYQEFIIYNKYRIINNIFIWIIPLISDLGIIETENLEFSVTFILKFKYGGCSLMVECGPVAPETRVRFPSSAFDSKFFGDQDDRF